jgi:hypothetical protein
MMRSTIQRHVTSHVCTHCRRLGRTHPVCYRAAARSQGFAGGGVVLLTILLTTILSCTLQNIPVDKVVVMFPADFVMAESVHQLMSELTALVYKYGECPSYTESPHSWHSRTLTHCWYDVSAPVASQQPSAEPGAEGCMQLQAMSAPRRAPASARPTCAAFTTTSTPRAT